MDDLILMLKDSVDEYTTAPSDSAYVAVVQTLLVCMKYNVSLWSVGRASVGADGAELMTPGMVAGDDNRYYFILCMDEADLDQYADGMSRIRLSLNALATRIAGDGELGGICLDPQNGGCFVPREQVIRLLESLAASMYD